MREQRFEDLEAGTRGERELPCNRVDAERMLSLGKQAEDGNGGADGARLGRGLPRTVISDDGQLGQVNLRSTPIRGASTSS